MRRRSPDPILTAHVSLAAFTLARECAWDQFENGDSREAFMELDVALSASLARIELLERRLKDAERGDHERSVQSGPVVGDGVERRSASDRSQDKERFGWAGVRPRRLGVVEAGGTVVPFPKSEAPTRQPPLGA